MANGGRIYFSNLKHVLETRKNQKGEDVECIVIPIKANGIYKGDKGSLSISFFFNDLHEKFLKVLRANGGTETHKMVMREDEDRKKARLAYNEANPDAKIYPTELGMATIDMAPKAHEPAPNVTNEIAGSAGTIDMPEDDKPF